MSYVCKLLFVVSVLWLVSERSTAQESSGPQKPEVKALGVEANGVERSVIEIRVDEYLSRNIHPLLNYVFFDDNSDRLPNRYTKMTDVGAATFRPERLYGLETLEVYYSLLNIIGHRLTKQPDSKITLVGCTANVGVEKGNLDLATRRANTVKNYFTSVWNIDASRITVQARDLPEKPSSSKESPTESDAENRRVEIVGSWDMMQPLIINDTLREATPPIVRFYTKLYNQETPAQWLLTANQRVGSTNRDLKKFNSTGAVRPILDWKINKEKNTIPLDTLPMTYLLDVRYSGSTPNQKSNRGSIPVQLVTVQKKRRERINDIEKDRYSLILFDFGSSKLGENNQRIVDIIKTDKRITPKTTKVTITGFTDVVGTADANKRISTERAKSVAESLGLKTFAIKDVKVEGKGKEPPLLYENEYPEGRFYCRTVVIEVENPVEYDK